MRLTAVNPCHHDNKTVIIVISFRYLKCAKHFLQLASEYTSYGCATEVSAKNDVGEG
jgi:hypothetical protein